MKNGAIVAGLSSFGKTRAPTHRVLDPPSDDSYNAPVTSCDPPAHPARPGRGPTGRRFTAGALTLVLVFGLAACGGSKKPLSVQAQTASRINTVIEDLQSHLEHCDRRGITSLLAPPLSNDATFARGLATLCERLSAIQPVFVVERLWTNNAETVRVDLQWMLRATLSPPSGPVSLPSNQPSGGPMMVMGTAHFTFVGKDSPRLSAVDGDNPFVLQTTQVLLP